MKTNAHMIAEFILTEILPWIAATALFLLVMLCAVACVMTERVAC